MTLHADKARWERFWFADGDPVNFAAMRIVVAVNAIWLLLSRPDLPELTSWPSLFFAHLTLARRIRFALFPWPASVERILLILLVALLVAVAAGVRVRLSAFGSALLLYHLGALEPLVGSIGLVWFACYTHIFFGLLFIGIASGRKREPYDDRWPVVALQTLFALFYFLSGLSKLYSPGFWATSENMRALVLAQQTREIFWTPLAGWFVSSQRACLVAAVLTLVVELAFPLVLFSRRARMLLVPAALAGHFGIAMTMGLVFLEAPLLLIYVDWARMVNWLRRWRSPRLQSSEDRGEVVRS